MDIFDKINRLKSLNLKDLTIQILNSKEIVDLVIGMQQDRLFNLGEDSKGESLGSYSPFTVIIKESKGQKTTNITLRDTGAFYDSMTFEVTKTQVIFDADGQKDDSNLFDDFGIDILGLNDFDRNRLIETVYQKLKFEIMRLL